MRKTKRQDDREKRIRMGIIVDAYGPEEQAVGWYNYLEDTLQFPFIVKCRSRRQVSPLKVGDTVEVKGMAEEDECAKEMFVAIAWNGDILAARLSQLDPLNDVNNETMQAVEDWHYWLEMGYVF